MAIDMMTTTVCIIIGFVLDLILGDPYCLPHPVRLIGKEISILENILYRKQDADRKKLIKGAIVTALVILSVITVVTTVLFVAFWLHYFVGVIVESIMCYQVLATKCLKVESMKVHKELVTGDIVRARKAVSMIVGRDTEILDAAGVTKAAVETVAENTSDGVIAPLMYLCIGGPVLAFAYKAINTMDSMMGYKNDRYLFFGRAAARLDDVVNYIPSRVSAYLMIGAAFLLGMDGKGAYRIHKRDSRAHASPNSAQTESVCAGALDIRLAGDAVYFGRVVRKPFIGDAIRDIEYDDIRKANRLLYVTAVLMLLSGIGLRLLVMYVIGQ